METMAAWETMEMMVAWEMLAETQAEFHHAMMHNSASATTSPSPLAPVVQVSVYMKMT